MGCRYDDFYGQCPSCGGEVSMQTKHFSLGEWSLRKLHVGDEISNIPELHNEHLESMENVSKHYSHLPKVPQNYVDPKGYYVLRDYGSHEETSECELLNRTLHHHQFL